MQTIDAKDKKALPNAKTFPRVTIESIRSLFERAGYTTEALGLDIKASGFKLGK